MKSMVEQVVEVLDNTDLDENVLGKSLSQMGYGKSRYDKKAKMQYRPADPTFFRHDKHWMKDKKNVKFLRKRLIDQEKERRRKLMKKRYPNDPLEWSGSRWVVKTTESVSVRENDERDRDKERQRKDLKMRYPNVPLRWNGRKWVLGKKKPSWKEIDSKRWLPDQELHGWEDMIDNLQKHIEEIRGWDPDPQPDGEGGWEQTADPVEWAQIDHEAERAFTKKQFAEQELTKVIEEVNGVPLHSRTWVDIPDPNEC